MYFGQSTTASDRKKRNITCNIAVTMKCVRNKFCAPTAQLVHKWQHITRQWKQITACVCVMREIPHPPQFPLRHTTQTSHIEAAAPNRPKLGQISKYLTLCKFREGGWNVWVGTKFSHRRPRRKYMDFRHVAPFRSHSALKATDCYSHFEKLFCNSV